MNLRGYRMLSEVAPCDGSVVVAGLDEGAHAGDLPQLSRGHSQGQGRHCNKKRSTYSSLWIFLEILAASHFTLRVDTQRTSLRTFVHGKF